MSQQPRLCLMVVHAHPDDEVITTGSTFLRYAAEGLDTVLVCATRGEEGEIHDPELDPAEAQPRLGEIRTRELTCAADQLHIGAVEHLGFRDSGMAGTPPNENPACFQQTDPEEATARLVRLIRRYRPHVLVSYNEFGGYGHPDHIKARQVTWSAFDRASDPEFAPTPKLVPWQPLKLYEIAEVREMVWQWRDHELEERRRQADAAATSPSDASKNSSSPSDSNEAAAHAKFFAVMESHSTPLAEVTTWIDVRAYRETCRDALRCHRTQIPADSHFFQPRADEPPEFVNFEHFNRARSLVRAPEREDDLFTGLR